MEPWYKDFGGENEFPNGNTNWDVGTDSTVNPFPWNVGAVELAVENEPPTVTGPYNDEVMLSTECFRNPAELVTQLETVGRGAANDWVSL